MKGYSIIILILGLGALISYWAIASDRMVRSFNEEQVSTELVPETKICESLCVKSNNPGNLKIVTAGSLSEPE